MTLLQLQVRGVSSMAHADIEYTRRGSVAEFVLAQKIVERSAQCVVEGHGLVWSFIACSASK